MITVLSGYKEDLTNNDKSIKHTKVRVKKQHLKKKKSAVLLLWRIKATIQYFLQFSSNSNNIVFR
jgi:hypothetical protein